jgi:Txe/YoeB family toxin of Txe-Axe toxin-antitoxin module
MHESTPMFRRHPLLYKVEGNNLLLAEMRYHYAK